MNDGTVLQEIADDIYTVTGIKAVFYDADRKQLFARPDTMGGFCQCVRKSNTLCARCLQSDEQSFARCKQTGETVIYHCHMGLIEVTAPVMENGTVVGYIQFGQLADQKEDVRRRVEKTDALSGKQEALSALEQMPLTDEGTIRASARLITMCASFVRLRTMLASRNEATATKLERFVMQKLCTEKLTVERICKEFGISRTTLYHLAKEHFGMGISEFIQKKRLEKAMTLLRQHTLSVSQVAEAVGICDANYLIKLIKKETGQTPKQIQLQNRKEDLS